MRSKASKARHAFHDGAISALMRLHATFVKATEPKLKTADEIVVRDAAVLQGLARAVVKTNGATLEKERDVPLTGKADNGLAIIACASLLKLDAAAKDKITLTYDTQGEFSKTAQLAIADTIKALNSSVDVIVKLKPAQQFKPNGPAA